MKRFLKLLRGLSSTISIQITTCKYGRFLWPCGVKPEEYDIFRVPGSSAASKRDIKDIPPQEIMNAALYVLESSISLPKENLIKETAKLLGFGRVGRIIEETIETAINMLLFDLADRRKAKLQDGMVILEE